MKAAAFCATCLPSLFVLLIAARTPAYAQQERTADASAKGVTRFIDGVTVGGGLAFYQGDLDANPGNNYLKFLGSSRLSLFAGVDRRYAGYALGLELGYDRLAGERQFGAGGSEYGFSNNLISLNAVGSLDLGHWGILSPGLLRPFLGAGPTLMAGPQYEGFSDDPPGFEGRGTRVRPNLTLGVNVQDAVRLGVRALPTDYVDGFTGRYFPYDQVVFINVSYRFDLTGER